MTPEELDGQGIEGSEIVEGEVQGERDLASLISAGFVRFGTWKVSVNPATQGIELDFVCSPDPGIYAFVVDGEVHYVGSAQRGLRGRMRRYARTQTMRTSARVRAEILACLSAGKVVEIYFLSPPDQKWHGLPVNMIAGLEEGLIRWLCPAWNRRSNPRRARAV